MVAHAGEIGIKSKTTRRFMIKILYKNISEKFPDFQLQYKNIANRTIITTDQPQLLAHQIADIIFGVSHTAPIFIFQWTSHEQLVSTFISYASQFIKPGQNFGFDARTSGKNRPHTQELKVELGSKLFDAFNGSISVNLTNPDFLFSVEVRDEFAWIYHEQYHGQDGFPQGAQKGRVFGNLHYWLNDYSAIFLTMRRGVNVRPVRFITEPQSDLIEQKWHENFSKDFFFTKVVEIPIYHLLQEWQPVFKDNLCMACMLFSEKLLSKACKLKGGSGIVSGLKLLSLQGDISNSNLKWIESQTKSFKIRPNLIASHEIDHLNKIFKNFPTINSCCTFQSKRLIKDILTTDQVNFIDDKAEEFLQIHFKSNYPSSQDEDSKELLK